MSACIEIANTLGELFRCEEVNQMTRIRTPFLYPDGDVIDVFLRREGETLTLTDLGESLRWLRQQGTGIKRSPKQNKLISDVCLTHGLELFRGMLVLRVKPGETLGKAVTRIAQGALRVSDLWFTLRTRTIETITDEVEDYLLTREVSYERGTNLIGRSGRSWRVDFHTRTSERSALVNVLSTGSRATARSVAEHVFAEWYDLNTLKLGLSALKFISLIDDTADVWTQEDINLVSEVSDIAYWSRPEEFQAVLTS